MNKLSNLANYINNINERIDSLALHYECSFSNINTDSNAAQL